MRATFIILVALLLGCDAGAHRTREESLLARTTACEQLGGKFKFTHKKDYKRANTFEQYDSDINGEYGKWRCEGARQ